MVSRGAGVDETSSPGLEDGPAACGGRSRGRPGWTGLFEKLSALSLKRMSVCVCWLVALFLFCAFAS